MEEVGIGWVRAAGGGEEVYWCGPLWLWEELAPWRGEGGWVGGAFFFVAILYRLEL